MGHDPGLPQGWTQEQANDYFNRMYEDNHRSAVRHGSLDINKPVETLYDPAKPPDDYEMRRDLAARASTLRRRVKYPSPERPKRK